MSENSEPQSDTRFTRLRRSFSRPKKALARSGSVDPCSSNKNVKEGSRKRARSSLFGFIARRSSKEAPQSPNTVITDCISDDESDNDARIVLPSSMMEVVYDITIDEVVAGTPATAAAIDEATTRRMDRGDSLTLELDREAAQRAARVELETKLWRARRRSASALAAPTPCLELNLDMSVGRAHEALMAEASAFASGIVPYGRLHLGDFEPPRGASGGAASEETSAPTSPSVSSTCSGVQMDAPELSSSDGQPITRSTYGLDAALFDALLYFRQQKSSTWTLEQDACLLQQYVTGCDPIVVPGKSGSAIHHRRISLTTPAAPQHAPQAVPQAAPAADDVSYALNYDEGPASGSSTAVCPQMSDAFKVFPVRGASLGDWRVLATLGVDDPADALEDPAAAWMEPTASGTAFRRSQLGLGAKLGV